MAFTSIELCITTKSSSFAYRKKLLVLLNIDSLLSWFIQIPFLKREGAYNKVHILSGQCKLWINEVTTWFPRLQIYHRQNMFTAVWRIDDTSTWLYFDVPFLKHYDLGTKFTFSDSNAMLCYQSEMSKWLLLYMLGFYEYKLLDFEDIHSVLLVEIETIVLKTHFWNY